MNQQKKISLKPNFYSTESRMKKYKINKNWRCTEIYQFVLEIQFSSITFILKAMLNVVLLKVRIITRVSD